MDFEIKVDFSIDDLINLNQAQSKAGRVYDWINDLKSTERDPKECADDLCQIIDMINDLHSKVPDLMKIFKQSESMRMHLRDYKE